MDEIDAFYRKIQMILMKKDEDCGRLQYLTTRSTTENINHIDDICKSMVDIFQTYNIPMNAKDLECNEKSVLAYKYLILNTNFENQERLMEDIINGHLVDMCPPLSPYLLIQILWTVGYENVLAESFIYLPLDLCIELLDITRKCIEEVPFERCIPVIHKLLLNLYIKFVSLKEIGSQSVNLVESMENLLAGFQELILLLSNPKIVRIKEVSGLKSDERHGVLLKKLIWTIKSCLSNDEPKFHTDLEKLYQISFGREPFAKPDDTYFERTMKTLNQELTNLLLKMIKEIDCNIYLGWVELDDQENKMISLQRSIGTDCYYLLELLKSNELLSENIHLMECLEQFSLKPGPEPSGFVLSLQELCHGINQGEKVHFKELMSRYREWDNAILDFVHQNKSLLDKRDCFQLLEYLTLVVKNSEKEDVKQHAYSLVTRLVLLQSIPDIYEIVIEYIMKYNGENHLECQYTKKSFNEFIIRNSNLRTPRNLRTILLFLLKNPKMVLTILIKITIGHPKYENVMIAPNDLLLLSPFMSIKEENNQILFTSILRTVCMESTEWNPKRFSDLLRVILDSSVVKVDDLMNNFFIPYLKKTNYNVSNINSILVNIRKIQGRCTKNMNVKELIITLAGNISYLRKNRNFSRYMSDEIFSHITRILEYFLDIRSNKINKNVKVEIIDGIENIIEPIDKIHFGSLWPLTKNGINVVDIIEDYERRCFVIIKDLKEDSKTSERLRNYLADVNLLREDFLRHLIMRSTETEYQKLALELTIVYWFVFGWNDEFDAYNNFLGLTMEACCLCLEHPCVGPRDLFVSLLKCFAAFCKVFVKLERMQKPEVVYQSLMRNVNSLDASIKHSNYASLFTEFRASLNNDVQRDSIYLLQHFLNMFDRFAAQCFELDRENAEQVSGLSHSPKIVKFYVTHEVISACIKAPASEAYECIRRMNELFVTH